MGCDGGSIPMRVELVKMKPKEERADPAEVEKIRWTYCAISNERLTPPIVSCELGFLYNKEVIIRLLLDKSIPKDFAHIRGLKDVREVHFKPNPNFQDTGKSSVHTFDPATDALFVCPISGLEVGKGRFSALRTCGHVFSDKSLRECPSAECLECGVPFAKDDVVVLNPRDTEVDELRSALDARRQAEKLVAKEKKKEKQRSKDAVKLADEKKESGKRKLEETSAGSSKRAGTSHIPIKVASSSPAVTGSTSETYKSLFTSSVKKPAMQLFTAT
eukprot:TRINITY_DN18275_c0_g1_i1.p1 TRINITY_DN18275_c0_g1~~TRINITY_DN18275_c0_g1_i1.p1  ORF type:complete len:274 (+),score=116.14 TRINITY_DN18275_c0_g1_i1:1170-1991(+)